MSSPKPVREKRWVKLFFWPAVIFFGIPAAAIWFFMHLVGLSFVCDCGPVQEPEWAALSRGFGVIVVAVPLLIADWFVIWKYRDYRRKQKWEKKYTEENAPWYAKTGEDRPKGPVKNEYYEP